MEDLKIKVNSVEERKEAQELFFEFGYGFEGCKIKEVQDLEYVSDYYFFAYANDADLTHSCDYGVFMNKMHKEITLQELRDMVKPKVREYLTKNSSGNYQLVNHRFSEDDIEVPEGAEILTIILGDKVFYKSGSPFRWFSEEQQTWFKCSDAVDWDGFNNALWKRQPITQTETLNDKVASAEVARQDNVNHPSHYAGNGVECIDAIQSSMTKEAFCGYLKGNIQKYVFRYENKGGVESLQKAQWYLNKLIEIEAL